MKNDGIVKFLISVTLISIFFLGVIDIITGINSVMINKKCSHFDETNGKCTEVNYMINNNTYQIKK